MRPRRPARLTVKARSKAADGMNWARRTDGARPIQCRPFGSGLPAANIPTNIVAARQRVMSWRCQNRQRRRSAFRRPAAGSSLGNECTRYIRPRRTALRRGVRAKPEPRCEKWRFLPPRLVFQRSPELAQALKSLLLRIARDDAGIDRPARSPNHPVRLDAGLMERLADPALIGVESAAALEREERLGPAKPSPSQLLWLRLRRCDASCSPILPPRGCTFGKARPLGDIGRHDTFAGNFFHEQIPTTGVRRVQRRHEGAQFLVERGVA
jgi:hypothetical protein